MEFRYINMRSLFFFAHLVILFPVVHPLPGSNLDTGAWEISSSLIPPDDRVENDPGTTGATDIAEEVPSLESGQSPESLMSLGGRCDTNQVKVGGKMRARQACTQMRQPSKNTGQQNQGGENGQGSNAQGSNEIPPLVEIAPFTPQKPKENEDLCPPLLVGPAKFPACHLESQDNIIDYPNRVSVTLLNCHPCTFSETLRSSMGRN